MSPTDDFPIETPDARRIDRRGFLRLAAATAGAVAGVERLSLSLPEPLTATAPPSLYLPGGAALAPGEARAVPLGASGRSGLLVRLDAGTIVAFDRRCPHLGCPVLWSRRRGRLECPCHDAAFDARTGRVLYGPPRSGVASIDVEIHGDDLRLRPAPVVANHPSEEDRCT